MNRKFSKLREQIERDSQCAVRLKQTYTHRESIADTYDSERRHSGIGRIRALYRALRYEITGKLYPS